MDSKQEKFLESSEVRTLKVTAELSFFGCFKGGFDPHTAGKLSEQAERVRAACLEASLSDEIISDILAKARHSAYRRFACRREVFVAASITGGREALPFVKFAVQFLEDKKYRVPSLHNAAFS